MRPTWFARCGVVRLRVRGYSMASLLVAADRGSFVSFGLFFLLWYYVRLGVVASLLHERRCLWMVSLMLIAAPALCMESLVSCAAVAL
jgi:hypothetical protein